MNRRELLMGAALLTAAATTGRALAAPHVHHVDYHHDDKLVSAAADCVAKANVCLQHCLVALGKGDTELAACASASREVIAMCNALLEMAAANSRHLPHLARLCMDVCRECEEECKKTEKHPECKACKEACAACYEACRKIAA